MSRCLFYTTAALLLTTACEQRQKAKLALQATPDTAVTTMQPELPQPVLPDTVDASRTYFGYRSGHDTTFYIGRQPYRLLLRTETDSTKPLVTITEGIVGPAFADDTSTFAETQRVRGYDGSQIITLLDSENRQVFQRRLRKANFYGVASRDIVTVSEPARPRFIGYHNANQTLAFTLDIGIPYSDVAQQCVILLGLDGGVRRLATSYKSSFDSPDCEPRMLPNGTVLTCQELLQPDGSHISLLKSKSQLVAAFPLTDSTLCTVYRYGEYRARPDHEEESSQTDASISAEFNDPEWVVDRTQRNALNAFVINLKGQVLKAFRYSGYQGAIGYEVPRRYVWQLHTYYLLDEERGLQLLEKHNPTSATEVLFSQMKRFQKPQQLSEVRFTVRTETAEFAFYVDTAHPAHLRYQRLEQLPY